MKNSFVLAGALLILSGCESYERVDYVDQVTTLDASYGVLISVPEDGFFGNENYRNSGKMTANAIRSAFSQHVKVVQITSDCHGTECLDGVDASKFGYYVQPDILHWEDRATEWSGKSDRLEIQMAIYSTETSEEIGNSLYKGKSTSFSFGGDHPQDLLDKPTKIFVGSLYQ
jgi:hypothetical protein